MEMSEMKTTLVGGGGTSVSWKMLIIKFNAQLELIWVCWYNVIDSDSISKRARLKNVQAISSIDYLWYLLLSVS